MGLASQTSIPEYSLIEGFAEVSSPKVKPIQEALTGVTGLIFLDKYRIDDARIDTISAGGKYFFEIAIQPPCPDVDTFKQVSDLVIAKLDLGNQLTVTNPD